MRANRPLEPDRLAPALLGWVAAGLITQAQADALRTHEAGLRAAEGASAARADEGPVSGRVRLAEVIGYVGAAFAVGALALILGDLWARLTVGGRLTLALLVTVLTLAAGAAVARRTAPPLRRLGAVLWLGSIAAAAWSAGILGAGLLDLTESALALLVAAITFVVATALLAVGRHAPSQLAALGSLLVAATSALDLVAPLPPTSLAVGIVLTGVGLAWLLAGIGGWIPPGWLAEIAGAGVALIGTQVLTFGFDGTTLPGLVLGLVLAAVYIAASILAARPLLLFVGAAGLFVIVPRLVFELFADTLGAPATLLVIGLLLILLAIGLTRVRRGQAAAASTGRSTVEETNDHD